VFRFTCAVLCKLHGQHIIFGIAVGLHVCDCIYSGVYVSIVNKAVYTLPASCAFFERMRLIS